MTSAARKVVTTSGGQWRWSLLSRTVARFTRVTSLAESELRQRSVTLCVDFGAGVCSRVGATKFSQLSKDSFKTVDLLRTPAAGRWGSAGTSDSVFDFWADRFIIHAATTLKNS